MLDTILAELSRLSASNISVREHSAFEPEAGELVEIVLEGAYWHMQPAHFLGLLKELPDDAGSEAVRMAIEGGDHPATLRGPEPEGSRDE